MGNQTPQHPPPFDNNNSTNDDATSHKGHTDSLISSSEKPASLQPMSANAKDDQVESASSVSTKIADEQSQNRDQQHATLLQQYHPFMVQDDQSLDDVRFRLTTAIRQTRELRLLFTDRVQTKFQIPLPAVPTLDEILRGCLAPGAAERLKWEMSFISSHTGSSKRHPESRLLKTLQLAGHDIPTTTNNNNVNGVNNSSNISSTACNSSNDGSFSSLYGNIGSSMTSKKVTRRKNSLDFGDNAQQVSMKKPLHLNMQPAAGSISSKNPLKRVATRISGNSTVSNLQKASMGAIFKQYPTLKRPKRTEPFEIWDTAKVRTDRATAVLGELSNMLHVRKEPYRDGDQSSTSSSLSDNRPHSLIINVGDDIDSKNVMKYGSVKEEVVLMGLVNASARIAKVKKKKDEERKQQMSAAVISKSGGGEKKSSTLPNTFKKDIDLSLAFSVFHALGLIARSTSSSSNFNKVIDSDANLNSQLYNFDEGESRESLFSNFVKLSEKSELDKHSKKSVNSCNVHDCEGRKRKDLPSSQVADIETQQPQSSKKSKSGSGRRSSETIGQPQSQHRQICMSTRPTSIPFQKALQQQQQQQHTNMHPSSTAQESNRRSQQYIHRQTYTRDTHIAGNHIPQHIIANGSLRSAAPIHRQQHHRHRHPQQQQQQQQQHVYLTQRQQHLLQQHTDGYGQNAHSHSVPRNMNPNLAQIQASANVYPTIYHSNQQNIMQQQNQQQQQQQHVVVSGNASRIISQQQTHLWSSQTRNALNFRRNAYGNDAHLSYRANQATYNPSSIEKSNNIQGSYNGYGNIHSSGGRVDRLTVPSQSNIVPRPPTASALLSMPDDNQNRSHHSAIRMDDVYDSGSFLESQFRNRHPNVSLVKKHIAPVASERNILDNHISQNGGTGDIMRRESSSAGLVRFGRVGLTQHSSTSSNKRNSATNNTKRIDAKPPKNNESNNDENAPELKFKPKLRFNYMISAPGLGKESIELVRNSCFHDVKPKEKAKSFEYLLKVWKKLPIPTELVLKPLREKLSKSSISKEAIAAIALLWLWKEHESTFQKVFQLGGRFDKDADCKRIITMVIDACVRVIHDGERTKKFDSPPNPILATTLVAKALNGILRVCPEADTMLPKIDKCFDILKKKRGGALRIKCRERVYLANIVSRQSFMSDSFGSKYVDFIVRSGDVIGHEDLAELVQDEEGYVSSLMVYDVILNGVGKSWEDPGRPLVGFISDFSGVELARKAHAKAMLQRSLFRFQASHKVGGGAGNAGIFGDGHIPSTSMLSPFLRCSRLEMENSEVDASLVNAGIYPAHHCDPLILDDTCFGDTPYGNHDYNVSTESRLPSRENCVNDDVSEIDHVSSANGDTPSDFILRRSTCPIDWIDVSSKFQSVTVNEHNQSAPESRSEKLGSSLTKNNSIIFSPMVQIVDENQLKTLEDHESDSLVSEEDLSDDAVLIRHQAVLDKMRVKIDRLMEARKNRHRDIPIH